MQLHSRSPVQIPCRCGKAWQPRKSVHTLVLDWEHVQLCAHGIEIAGHIGLPLAKSLDDASTISNFDD